jgi:hypothetical protein
MPAPSVTIKDGTMAITIDVSKDAYEAAPVSNSGKTRMICTTSGFVNFDTPAGPVKLGLNLVRPL